MKNANDNKLRAGLAAIVLLGFAVGIWPNLSGASRLDAERRDLETRVERSDDGAAALDRLNATLVSLDADARRRLKDIPKDGDVGGLIRDMSHRFTELGLGRPEIKTGRPLEHDEARALPMTVELRGDFLRLMTAIAWLESLDRLLRVRKINFETPVGKDREILFGDPLECEIVLDVFFEPTFESPLTVSAIADAEGS